MIFCNLSEQLFCAFASSVLVTVHELIYATSSVNQLAFASVEWVRRARNFEFYQRISYPINVDGFLRSYCRTGDKYIFVRHVFKCYGTIAFWVNSLFHLLFFLKKLRRERDSNPRYLAVRRFSRPLQSTTLPSLRKVVQRYTTFFNYAIGSLKIFAILFAMVDIEWWPMKPTHLWFACRCLTLIDLVCHVRIQQSKFVQVMCMKYAVCSH